jgi:N utilization substance protein B
MKRRELREHVFRLVFTLGGGALTEEGLGFYFPDNEIGDEDAAYIRGVVSGIFDRLETVDKIIADNTKGYTFDRISKVCLAAMRVAVYEILYMDEIPQNVSVSEAMLIVEKYEEETSKAFVNGILGGFLRSSVQNEEQG